MLKLNQALAIQLSVLVSVFIFTVFTAPVAQAIDAADKRAVALKHYKWLGEVPKAKLIRIINPFGAITSRNTSYNNVELSGVIQKIGQDSITQNSSAHQISITDVDGVTEVVVSYPQGNKNSQGQLIGRFDLGVWVPSWVAVEMTTDFGDIKVKKHASNIIAKTHSGKIKIGSAGRVIASSYSGDIKVDLYGERWHQAMDISSVTGNVKVNVSRTANINLQALSGNDIKHNLTNLDNITTTIGDDHQLTAQFDQQGQRRLRTPLQLTATHGQLSVYVADQPAYHIKATPKLFNL